MYGFAFTSTKWALNIASKLIKADVRMHNLDVLRDDMSILFVVNHFTRLETLLLPYQFHKHTGREVWSMAAGDLFVGRIGDYLRQMGTVSTKDPDRDKVITHSLLKGEHPWIIFPEGQMIKDKKVVDPAGTYSVYNDGMGTRRSPHKGAAILALRAEFYRHKLRCIYDSPKQIGLEETKERFDIEDVESVIKKRTVVIPVNVTYYPIRARDNLVVRMARTLAKGDLSPRALEELSVEGTFLSSDSDIDITLGQPIDLDQYLNQPRYGEIMACGDDLSKLEMDPRSLFNEAAEELMMKYMKDIYQLTRVNYDHVFATIIRYQGAKPFSERAYRNRIYLCAHELRKRGDIHMHELFRTTYRQIIFEDPSPKFHDFIKLAIKEGVIEDHGNVYARVPGVQRGKSGFHEVRANETTYVIANEIEPIDGVVDLVKSVARMPRKALSERIRGIFFNEDARLFEEDYERFKTAESHPMNVGRPFLLTPDRIKAGIVLVHGYMAAPLEVRAMAEYLFERGYAVYGVRLRGHGTSPEDLAQTRWEEWYTSLNRGYVVIKSITDRVILGGFSTGGCMALMGAGLKQDKVQGAFSICAPRKLRQYSARHASKVVSFNNLLKKMNRGVDGWDFVANDPENPQINYSRNPLSGVAQLGEAMEATEEFLPTIVSPALVIQASKDHVVHPSSGPDIFERIGTPLKELTVFERERHGIVNGAGSADVFERVAQFIEWALRQVPVAGKPVAELETEADEALLERVPKPA